MIYYLADTHFGDGRVMMLAKRPFSEVEEMNRALIERWNRRVSSADDVYILGDFAVSDAVACEILPLLNGRKHLIVGNHDSALTTSLTAFESVSQLQRIDDNGRCVVLCHYPLLSYENSIYGGYQVFGHIHNNPDDIATRFVRQLSRSLHAGADMTGFAPKTLDELIAMKEDESN
ncbi:MAG: hydrolase [Clostridia bacterium]|nr:hydrolase [Clostridia bacterium]